MVEKDVRAQKRAKETSLSWKLADLQRNLDLVAHPPVPPEMVGKLQENCRVGSSPQLRYASSPQGRSDSPTAAMKGITSSQHQAALSEEPPKTEPLSSFLARRE